MGKIFIKKKSELAEEKNKPSLNDKIKAITFAIEKLIRIDELSEEEIEKIKLMYDRFEDLVGEVIPKDKKLLYNGQLYKSLSEHKVDENYNPEVTNYRYVLATPSEVIDYWKEPSGYEDAYSKDDKVIYKPNEKTYISKINGNTQEPTKDEPHNRYWNEVI